MRYCRVLGRLGSRQRACQARRHRPGGRLPLAAVDEELRTSRPGVFCAGNVAHPAETADIAALGGCQAARSIERFLGSPSWPAKRVEIRTAYPLLWAHPAWLAGGPPSLSRVILRSARFLQHGYLQVSQGGRVLGRETKRRVMPNRSISIRGDWVARVQPADGPVVISWSD